MVLSRPHTKNIKTVACTVVWIEFGMHCKGYVLALSRQRSTIAIYCPIRQFAQNLSRYNATMYFKWAKRSAV